MAEKPSSRYDDSMPEHTGKEDCPACARIKEEMSPEQEEELVDQLMEQWDQLITRWGNRLVERVRLTGHERLKAFKANYAPKKVPRK